MGEQEAGDDLVESPTDIVTGLRRRAEFWSQVVVDGLGYYDGNDARIDREAADEIERLRSALEPFATFGARNVDGDGWTSNIHREQISTWFGPSDFRNARAGLSQAKGGE